MTIASPRQPKEPAHRGTFSLAKLWTWLTQCDVEGCGERPVHLGWCAQHAPEYLPPPDEFWGDPQRPDRS